MSEARLFGREHELRVLKERLDTVGERGSALLIHGDAGIGKSALLDAARSLAQVRGMSILTTVGLKCESNVPYIGLHELLHPILDRAKDQPGPQQLALRGAFGLPEASADLFLVALGALDLLGEFAAERPLLLVVDDAQWLDSSSMQILVFTARRLQSSPIVLLIASRDSAEMPFSGVIPELHIEGLDDFEALALLQEYSPHLSTDIRERVLRESAGNPLALLELPKAIASEPSVNGLLPEHLPLTARLERAFAARISELPDITRQLLLIAAVNDGSSLVETMTAANVLNGSRVSLDALTPAISADLIRVDAARLYLRHPLVRSAIHHVASIAERFAAHAALATALQDDPDRSVWHQAAATVGVDEAVAERLEKSAVRARQRGDVRAAIRAFERAAQLSSDATRRADHLLQAAELAFDIGWPAVVASLLRQADSQALAPRDRMRLTCYREAVERTISGAQALTNIVDNIKNEDDVDVALDLLSGPATAKGWWAERDEQGCNQIIAALESVRTSSEDDPRFLLILAMTSPVDRGAFVIDALHRLISPFRGDGRIARVLGLVATQVGDFEVAVRFFDIAVASLRTEGRLTLLASALVLRSLSAVYLGNRDVAITDADEGERLASETDQPIYRSVARAVSAMVAALRGEYDTAERMAAEAEHMTDAFGTVLGGVQMARGMNALCAGRFEDAYQHYLRMFSPADIAYHPMKECFCIGDLAEAAVQSGHREAAKTKLLEMEELARRTPSPQFHDAMRYARAILAEYADAERLFEAGLAAVRSPLIHARLRLAFGRWLRHARRGREARGILKAAMESFDRLHALAWGERARKELRALGVMVQRRTPEQREELTPQELQIALMAAEGLSNREIGQKLYLSHRTVGSHLYRAFSKLEITSRHQLPSVLASERAVAT